MLIDPLFPNTLSGFNSAAWFLIILFYIEVIYFFISKIVSTKHKNILFFCIFLLLGLFSIKLSMNEFYMRNGKRNLVVMNLLRLFCLFPYFPFGCLYKKYIESKIKVSQIKIIVILVCTLLITYMIFPNYYGNSIDYKQCQFAYLLPTYVVGICGILFWLYISKLLRPLLGDLRIINIIGTNTFSIMMYHL